ncbi:DUF3164 family protein [Rhizobium sp. S163]|uniref:DUF3164 family protein n=1 Tax=Rhizobium sp. S163 TaxID=3055039 RepID=UPI0025A93709|nr:DUF3164 family protein [Rhizobium sp. S163]MDM9647723.1 DUF3164 family protein [Rhizobium sp. S163]
MADTDRPGVTEINGKLFMINAKGGFDPMVAVKDQHKVEDTTVRNIFQFAEELSAQVTRFKDHTFADLAALDAVLAQQYDTKIGGQKGNRTYTSYDGLLKIQVQVADNITFGPELQIAKSLIDTCLVEWSADSREEIQSIIMRAFNTDKEGKVNRSDIFMLLKLEIKDPRWINAMKAIRDAIRVTGSKEYVRFYRRRTQQEDWTSVTIDMAKA